LLPFTVERFFSVFADYNAAIWPAQIVAYVLLALALWAVFTERPRAGRFAGAILGVFWLWNGLAYHLTYFAPINPAAFAFAALFVVQGLLFLAHAAIGGRLALSFGTDWRRIAGLVLIVYAALVYELLGFLSGHGWPRAPLFGVAPCPTAIFTFGLLLLTARPIPIWLVAIPVIWTGIGATAAILLDIYEDLGLLASGVLGLALLPSWGRRRLDDRSQSPPIDTKS